MEQIKRKQAERFQFLKLLYDKTEHFYQYEAKSAAEIANFSPQEIGAELDLSPVAAEQIARYLIDEGLARKIAVHALVITHQGQVEVEEALTRPEESTEHFPANVYNIISAHTIADAQIQQGTDASAIVVLGPSDLAPLKTTLEEIRAILPELPITEDQQAEAGADIAVVEAQLKSPRPKKNIIKPALESLRKCLQPMITTAVVETVKTRLPELLRNLDRFLTGLH